ncbi:hypothetical protein K466DRAFT_569041 [Polyporus arcularius HHB13444]|uniref:Uncharacterized protein n=1 Tax=Polyporus arcularius HHB13444 TaxID=1314778 RepID=A0A5C3NYG3_9APHY|nr:hypothetical protein K466DRAFT_569041 [Polyporus arcularius HHB13444]
MPTRLPGSHNGQDFGLPGMHTGTLENMQVVAGLQWYSHWMHKKDTFRDIVVGAINQKGVQPGGNMNPASSPVEEYDNDHLCTLGVTSSKGGLIINLLRVRELLDNARLPEEMSLRRTVELRDLHECTFPMGIFILSILAGSGMSNNIMLT